MKEERAGEVVSGGRVCGGVGVRGDGIDHELLGIGGIIGGDIWCKVWLAFCFSRLCLSFFFVFFSSFLLNIRFGSGRGMREAPECADDGGGSERGKSEKLPEECEILRSQQRRKVAVLGVPLHIEEKA